MSTTGSGSSYEPSLELKENTIELKYDAFELKQQKFELYQQSFEQKQLEHAFEQRQKDIEQTLELNQRETKLDLQRREDALVNQIEQHAANVKNDKAVIEQERLSLQQESFSLQQIRAVNEQEMTRLLELKQRIESLIQQYHQITGANSFESFHIEDVSLLQQFPETQPTTATTTITTPPIITTAGAVVVVPESAEAIAKQLSALDLRGRQLKAVSKLVEQRYDDAVRKEYSNQQREQEIETKRKDFEDEKAVLREKIRSGQFDLLSNGNDDDDFTLGLVNYAVSLPLDRLNVIHTLELDGINAEMILSMNEADFKSEQFQKRIQACKVLKLDQIEVNRVIFLSTDEWVNDSLYAEHIAEEKRLMSIIKSCKKNSQHYGKTEAHPSIEYRCPQLGKQVHLDYYHYSKLIDVLYSNQGGNPEQSDCVNPYNPLQKSNPYTIFNYYWRSDLLSGKIPKLVPDLKLFFASPNISNGEWIQFHGPGTAFYDVDPTFVLYLGSLCDPNKPGKFTSEQISDDLSGNSRTSPYQVSIKWE